MPTSYDHLVESASSLDQKNLQALIDALQAMHSERERGDTKNDTKDDQTSFDVLENPNELRVVAPDTVVRHVWRNNDPDSDDQGEVTVYPDFYQDNGQPACPETGEVLEYLRTEIDLAKIPHVRRLIALAQDMALILPGYSGYGDISRENRTKADYQELIGELPRRLRDSSHDDFHRMAALLSDDRYPDSKDWASGGLVERVDWLVTMYESKKRELDDHYARLANDGSRPSTAEDPNIDGLHRLSRQIIDDIEAVHSAGDDVREMWPDMWENYLHACAMLGHEAMDEPGTDGPESHKL